MYVKRENAMASTERRTKAAQRAATMHRLVEIGREMFTEQGYAQAANEEIVGRAGLTRGALYHHFGGKEGLFRAVLEDVQQDVARRVAEAAEAAPSPWEQLRAGCVAFLRASLDPQVQRIMLIDAPAVLGWEVWRQLDAAHSMKLLQDALHTLIIEKTIAPLPVAALTHLLSGAMNEAALWIARAEQPDQALADATLTLEYLLASLQEDAPSQ
jgi:AcrR family transcriptional regulator